MAPPPLRGLCGHQLGIWVLLPAGANSTWAKVQIFFGWSKTGRLREVDGR